MVGIDKAWNQPIRRIYLVWGLVLLIGFTLTAYGFQDGWLHWYPISIIGLLAQTIKMRLRDIRAKILLAMWATVSLGGTFYSHQLMVGGFEFPSFFTSFAVLWLGLMSIPQIITGYIMQSKFQMAIGGLWVILSVLFKFFIQIDEMTLSLLTAVVTGLPYLYIAFRK